MLALQNSLQDGRIKFPLHNSRDWLSIKQNNEKTGCNSVHLFEGIEIFLDVSFVLTHLY